MANISQTESYRFHLPWLQQTYLVTCYFPQFVIAAVLAIAFAAPSSYKPEYKAPVYTAPAYSAPAYNKDNKYADITITSQSDERNLDGSSQWR